MNPVVSGCGPIGVQSLPSGFVVWRARALLCDLTKYDLCACAVPLQVFAPVSPGSTSLAQPQDAVYPLSARLPLDVADLPPLQYMLFPLAGVFGLESRRQKLGLDQHAFKDIALLPDNALGSLGEIIRECFVKLAIPTQTLLQLLVLLGKKNGGSRTIAILHTTYRLTMRLVSAHISQWDVNFAGKWDSALKGNSALVAHVARAMGIELAHSEGQCVIHFLWEMRKFYDSIKAHLLIPQLVARGYPLEILVLGTLTHKSPRCLQVGNSYRNIIMGCASCILAGCLQSCSWARGLLFEFVQALGYVVPGSVCEEHIDDLSHFVTNKSRMQLFQDAAEIGRAVQVGTAELGLTLSCKSTLLANDKSLGKLVVKHLETDGVPICLGTAATDLGIETAAGKRRCAASQWKRILERQAKGQESQSPVQDELRSAKTHDDGHSPCSNLWSHSAGSIQRTGRRHVQKSEVGHGFGKDPSMHHHHSRMVFRSQAGTTDCCQC